MNITQNIFAFKWGIKLLCLIEAWRNLTTRLPLSVAPNILAVYRAISEYLELAREQVQ